MTETSSVEGDITRQLIAIEESLWSNNPDVYHDIYSPEAVLIFPKVGRIDRDIAVAAIRQENAEGRAWAEVSFDEVCAKWIWQDTAALISYVATARWNDESTPSQTLCATVYVQLDGSWRVAFHQQTDGASGVST
jgi:hypothetical protein